jgi:hypothetical protein
MSVGWGIVCFYTGFILGFFIAALMAANGRSEGEQ